MPAAEAQSRAGQLLEVLDLTGDGHRLVADYSTGMRKKAALGCALIHNPACCSWTSRWKASTRVGRRDPPAADPVRRLGFHRSCSPATSWSSSSRSATTCRSSARAGSWRPAPPPQVRGGKTLQQAFIDLVGSQRRRGGCSCHGSGPCPAETPAAVQRGPLVPARPGVVPAPAPDFALIVAIGTFCSWHCLRGASTQSRLTATIFTLFAFGWLILPIMSFGLDGTLDPATLALYPLRTRSLAVGLLAASAAGAWPLANVIGLLGVTVGLARARLACSSPCSRSCSRCCSASRWPGSFTTSLAGLLRSRRGKDFAAFLVVPLFALYELFAQTVPRLAAEGKITGACLRRGDRPVAAVAAAWARPRTPSRTPPRSSPVPRCSAGAAGGASSVLGALWIRFAPPGRWSRSTPRPVVGGPRRAAAVRPSGLGGAVAARFLVYQRRDPASIVRGASSRSSWARPPIAALRTPHYAVGLVLSAVLGAGMVSLLQATRSGSPGRRSGGRHRA